MESLTLAANKRGPGTKGTLAALRREGRVPGVLYGLKSDPMTLDVKATDLRVILPKRNHVIELTIDGQTVKTMVKQVDRDPIRLDARHVDFLRVDEVQPVTVQVAVIPQGMPVGVKIEGGVFSVSKKFVILKATIREIPENFTIDVSGLKTGDTVYARDLKLGKCVLITPGRTALFGVGIAKVEEVVEPTPAATAAPEGGDKAAAPGAGEKDKAAAPGGKDKAPAAAGKDKAAPAAPTTPAKGEAKGKK